MDRTEFSEFFADHFDDVWRYARSRCTSATDADDVAAEAFAIAWRRRDDMPPGNEARLWLFGTARWVITSRRRDAFRRDRLHLRLASAGEFAGAAPAVEPADTLVWQALAELAENDREMLLLRCWDELSVAEIAGVLGVEPATVSSRLYKARHRLEKIISEHRRDPGASRHVPVDPAQRREPRQ